MVDSDEHLARAWHAHSAKVETSGFYATAILACALLPTWIPLDYVLETPHFRRFAILRLADCVLGLATLVGIARSKTLESKRIWMSLRLLLVGGAIAFMLPVVKNYPVYVFGFSCVFWGSGVLLSWPTKYSVVTYSAILLWSVSLQVFAWPRSTVELLGATFYIVTAAIIGGSSIFLRRRLEWKAFEASHQLAARNHELGIVVTNLRDAQARLVASEKLSALGRLLSGLSHEINNPVNVISNNVEPLQEYAASVTELLVAAKDPTLESMNALRKRWNELDMDFVFEDFSGAVSAMGTAARRIRTIHNDLRLFLRGDAPERVEADLNEGVRSTLSMMQRSVPRDVSLHVEYGVLPSSVFQPGQMNQVLMNLLQNALDAVGNRGDIWIHTFATNQHVTVTIADSGSGVSEQAKSHLFEPFFTTKEIGKGTGLGLATCYQILKQHGGTIELDEHHEKGARFVVSIPVVAPRGDLVPLDTRN